jgi:dUTP pyrophosphatase
MTHFMSPSSYSRLIETTIKVKRLEKNAIIPTKPNNDDAGWDLYAIISRSLAPNQRVVYRTGISLEIPEGIVGLVWPRSGLSVKHGIDVLAGVIDSGYRGEIQVCLLNTSDIWVEIQEGERIAQILFQEIPKIKLEEVTLLANSDRGENGFGSSGK